jgi:hypothetical protein
MLSEFLQSLSPHLWWDMDKNQLDDQLHAGQIIVRIAMRGGEEDFKKMIRFYGRDVIVKHLTSARYLDKLTLNFCACIFNVPLTSFRCYTEKPLMTTHFDY